MNNQSENLEQSKKNAKARLVALKTEFLTLWQNLGNDAYKSDSWRNYCNQRALCNRLGCII